MLAHFCVLEAFTFMWGETSMIWNFKIFFFYCYSGVCVRTIVSDVLLIFITNFWSHVYSLFCHKQCFSSVSQMFLLSISRVTTMEARSGAQKQLFLRRWPAMLLQLAWQVLVLPRVFLVTPGVDLPCYASIVHSCFSLVFLLLLIIGLLEPDPKPLWVNGKTPIDFCRLWSRRFHSHKKKVLFLASTLLHFIESTPTSC